MNTKANAMDYAMKLTIDDFENSDSQAIVRTIVRP
jgi:hypothetical protein